MKLKVKTNKNNYSIIIGKNLCSKIYKIILNERIYSQKFLLVYDSKVPSQMIKSIISRFKKDGAIFLKGKFDCWYEMPCVDNADRTSHDFSL